MKEAKGNLWDSGAEVIVITTNGFVKNNGEAVMGRGCALEAKNIWPSFPKALGKVLREHGNNVHVFDFPDGHHLVTFPVKHHWREKADLKLIRRSVNQLIAEASLLHTWKTIALPRPGCGNGRLDWETEVKPLLVDKLDDRFTVYTF